MKNLYQQFTMQPPNKATLAERLTGTKARVTGVAVPVHASRAPETFFRKANVARNNVEERTPYILGDQGGLSGFGMLGSFGGVPLGAGGVEFKFDLDRLDFFGRAKHQEGLKRLKLFWAPPSNDLVSQADKKLNLLRQSGSKGSSMAAAFIQEGQRLADRIFDVGEKVAWESPLLGARGEVDIFNKVINDQPERGRIEAMEELKAWLETVAAAPVPSKATTSTTTSDGSVPKGTTTGDPTMDALIEAQVKKDQDTKNQQVANNVGKVAEAATPFYLNPIVLGVGGLAVVGGLAFVLLRKKG